MIERDGQTWLTIKEIAEKEIERLRDLLEAEDNPEARGQIKALRNILVLGEPPKVSPVSTRLRQSHIA